ncbi:FAD-binding domain-containing protein [Desarmillaria tabescens]|uniref:FAD-binding domain-containing protein n=1 Tax=Armillaria tabescens TaxID=1929756 RepID=A0AA39KEY7_ARMTA|nr:FAD-binding domain-containing protein [Desarmillaria tabescens]KAK0458559.1 FAD-binding domain-containing protein [Desarmillaria tabescens]
MFSRRLFVFSVFYWPVFATPTANDWKNLADSLDGRLHTTLPFAASCFSTVNGVPDTPSEIECAEVQADYANATVRSSHFSAYMMPQWETCQRTSERCLLDPSNTSNPAAFEGSDCLQGSVPAHYIDVQSAEDVRKALEFSKATGIPLSIKASGHDYKGRSSLRRLTFSYGFVIFFDHLKYSADFVPEGGNKSYRAITMGAGVPFQDVYEFADANNVTIIGAYHQTVTPSGGWVMASNSRLDQITYTLIYAIQGGGHSVLTPVYGFGVDRVLQFKIVTPDGKFRVANEFQHPDLFWALRGGGGSTFGVVLESTMLVQPQNESHSASAAISFPQTAENGVPFLKLLVDHTYRWGTEGWGGHMRSNGIINVNPLLTLEEAQVSVQPIVDYALAQNGTAVVEELPSWMTFFTKYVLSAEAAKTTLGSRLIPAEKFTTDSGKAELLDILTRMVQQFSINPYIRVVGSQFLYNYTEGSTSVTPAWRNALWHMSLSRTFSWNSTAQDMRSQYESVSTITQSLRDFSPESGVYLNECDVYEPNHEEAFWGSNCWILVLTRKSSDPFHLLDCWMCVGWKGSLDERYSCYL